jgi:hypothetical protein
MTVVVGKEQIERRRATTTRMTLLLLYSDSPRW